MYMIRSCHIITIIILVVGIKDHRVSRLLSYQVNSVHSKGCMAFNAEATSLMPGQRKLTSVAWGSHLKTLFSVTWNQHACLKVNLFGTP